MLNIFKEAFLPGVSVFNSNHRALPDNAIKISRKVLDSAPIQRNKFNQN